ncbi:MAG TPA: type II toxin-antitoxin system VapC family toxin [Pseudonocardiaceae bacterium]|jgi:hypothetical protein|nr:type II toxin-antitoxin system VapC family toxin [Pseudonocardiaceae bacterium]
MLLPDVNVLVYAFWKDHERYEDYYAWLASSLTGSEPVGISELVLSGFIRVVTNRRIYVEPATTKAALNFCDAVLHGPAAIPVRPGARHWGIFADLCGQVNARANLVQDTFHAALAIEHDATWITADRDFARFPGLRWALPVS